MQPVYTLPGGAKVGPREPFVLVRSIPRPVQYPKGWLTSANDAQLAEKSITKTSTYILPNGEEIDANAAFEVSREIVTEVPAEQEGMPPSRHVETVTDHYAPGWLVSASDAALAGLGIRKKVIYSLPGDRILDPETPFSLGETILDSDAIQYPAGWLALASPADLDAHGITVETPAPTKADLKAYAAAKRKAVIEAGCVVDVNGTATPVWADGQAQAALTGAVVAAQAVGAGFATAWKGRDGDFYPQTATSIVMLALGVMAFVNAAFAAEQAIVDAIDAGTIMTLAHIDGAAWPANS